MLWKPVLLSCSAYYRCKRPAFLRKSPIEGRGGIGFITDAQEKSARESLALDAFVESLAVCLQDLHCAAKLLVVLGLLRPLFGSRSGAFFVVRQHLIGVAGNHDVWSHAGVLRIWIFDNLATGRVVLRDGENQG